MSKTALDRTIVIVAFVLGWHGVHLIVGEFALASPWTTAVAAVDLLASPSFGQHALASFKALALSFAIAALGGIGLGVWLGASRLAGAVAEPILIAVYALPKVTLFPLILLIFGLGLSSKVAFGALHGIVPITIFVLSSVRGIPAVLVKTARSLGLKPRQTVFHVLLPSALPEVLSGLRVGLSLTLLGTLIGEMFAAREGVGFLLMQGISLVDGEQILAITLLLFLAALGMNTMLYRLEYRARGNSAQ